MARQKNLSHIWLGKKILPINGSRKTAFGIRENGSPPIPSESEETLLCRRKSLAIFDGRGRVPRKFIEFSGDNEKKDRRSFFLRKKRLKIFSFPSKWEERTSPQIHGPPRESHFCPPKIACNFGGTEWIRGGVP